MGVCYGERILRNYLANCGFCGMLTLEAPGPMGLRSRGIGYRYGVGFAGGCPSQMREVSSRGAASCCRLLVAEFISPKKCILLIL